MQTTTAILSGVHTKIEGEALVHEVNAKMQILHRKNRCRELMNGENRWRSQELSPSSSNDIHAYNGNFQTLV